MSRYSNTDQEDIHEHDRGLAHDLPILLSRRGALSVLGGFGLVTLNGCAASPLAGTASTPPASPRSTPSASESSTGAATGELIPEETAGPFPSNGSNGRNVLNQSGVVRSDITASFGTASGVVTGVPLTVTLTVLDSRNGSSAYPGAAVYLWHATPDGRYSMYSDGVKEENYLRGVQECDAAGQVTFTTIYPGAYDGRWPHIHFEVYPGVEDAVNASSRLRTSQLAFPETESALVYATNGYANSSANLAGSSLESDMVFSDGYSLQLATMSGTVTNGMLATLNVPV